MKENSCQNQELKSVVDNGSFNSNNKCMKTCERQKS